MVYTILVRVHSLKVAVTGFTLSFCVINGGLGVITIVLSTMLLLICIEFAKAHQIYSHVYFSLKWKI